MDTGKLNNTVFYDGYENEGELILSIPGDNNMTIIHIWDGYFEDIFGHPITTDSGWFGFTKDYQESVRTFNDEERIAPSATSEYLSDLKKYRNNTFSYPETKDCLNLLINFFEQAISHSAAISVVIR